MTIHPEMPDPRAHESLAHQPEEARVSTEKAGKGRDNPRDLVDALKTKVQDARAAVDETLDEQDESLLRAEEHGEAAERKAEEANVSERAEDKYFEIDKRVGGAEITLAEELAEAGNASRRHRQGRGSTR
jgi:hypothetical protein